MTEGLDLPTLTGFFTEHVPGFAGELTAELVTGGRSNLTYLLTDGRARWILRRAPLGGLTPSAHDMRREYRVVAALANSEVPVARTVAFGDMMGAEFSVVEHVAGTVIRTTDELHTLPAADITRCGYALVEVLARLHAVDPHTVGLADFGRPQGFLARQIRRWHDQWQRVHTHSLSDVDTLRSRLAEACPTESDVSIVHGDYRVDNTILDANDPGRIVGVLDWEMSTIGDPLADLGLTLCYWPDGGDVDEFKKAFGHITVTSADGFLTRKEVAERYADLTGRDVSQVAFYWSFGFFKLAVILEGIHARFLQGKTVGEGFETIGERVPPLVMLGTYVLDRGEVGPI